MIDRKLTRSPGAWDGNEGFIAVGDRSYRDALWCL